MAIRERYIGVYGAIVVALSKRALLTQIFFSIEKRLSANITCVKQKLPPLTGDEFRDMLRAIDPCHENRYIHARNATAHHIAPQQAQEHVANNNEPHLLRWVDVMDACEDTEEACIGDVALCTSLHAEGRLYVWPQGAFFLIKGARRRAIGCPPGHVLARPECLW